MRDLFSSRMVGWLVRGTTALALAATLMTAGCGDEGQPVSPSPTPDSGSDAKGMADRAPDAPSDRGGGGDTSTEGSTSDVTPGGDTGPDQSIDAPASDSDAAGTGDSRSDGDGASADVKMDVAPDAPVPACNDMMKNGTETDVDCGGMCAGTKKCADGKGCLVGSECTRGVCPR